MTSLSPQNDTDKLLRLAGEGDALAIEQLMAGFRGRVKRMIQIRMDARVSKRIDPSDVVQDVMAEANRCLPEYLRTQAVGFYPWLRKIALNKLVDVHRKHVQAGRRSVLRERDNAVGLSNESAGDLFNQIAVSETGPLQRIAKRELQRATHRALESLPQLDRDVLTMRFLEQMTVAEVADTLGCSTGAVATRQYRAIRRLRELLSDALEESQ